MLQELSQILNLLIIHLPGFIFTVEEGRWEDGEKDESTGW